MLEGWGIGLYNEGMNVRWLGHWAKLWTSGLAGAPHPRPSGCRQESCFGIQKATYGTEVLFFYIYIYWISAVVPILWVLPVSTQILAGPYVNFNNL